MQTGLWLYFLQLHKYLPFKTHEMPAPSDNPFPNKKNFAVLNSHLIICIDHVVVVTFQ